jgi:hypothetical protein
MPSPSTAIGSATQHRLSQPKPVFQEALDQAASGRPLYMRQATLADLGTIEQMVSDAKGRLRELGTDQWLNDGWPDEAGRGRMARVRYSIERGRTWIAEFGILLNVGVTTIPAATVTLDRDGSPTVWTKQERDQYPAVYLSRLIVASKFSSFDIGASVIDWAGQLSSDDYNARSIRIDVWTTNKTLHNYYLKRGFKKRGRVADPDYPAGQRFERFMRYESGLMRSVVMGGYAQSTIGEELI